MVREIKSPSNPLFKELLSLEKAKGIRKYGKAIVSGERLVAELLRKTPEICEAIVFTKNHDLSSFLGRGDQGLYYLAPGLFKRLDFLGTDYPLLVVQARALENWAMDEPGEGCTLCIPFQDPLNVGAAVRSAWAFGVRRVVLLSEAANPYLPKAIRASAGAVFRVPIFLGPSLQELSGSGLTLIALRQDGIELHEFDFPESFCLVAGMEGPGFPKGFEASSFVSIPMASGVESLNAAVSVSIALYVWKYGVKT